MCKNLTDIAQTSQFLQPELDKFIAFMCAIENADKAFGRARKEVLG